MLEATLCFLEENLKMLGSKECIIVEEMKKQGKLISDVQDSLKQTQLMRQKMMIKKEMEKIRKTKHLQPLPDLFLYSTTEHAKYYRHPSVSS